MVPRTDLPGPVRAGLVVAGLGAAATWVALVDPNEPGNYPTCPVRWLTGLDCPGCGSLRALHALTAGDLGGALDHNALLVLVLPAVVMMAARWAAARRPPKVLFTRYAGWSALTMVLGWAVVRNLPFEWLAVLRSGRG